MPDMYGHDQTWPCSSSRDHSQTSRCLLISFYDPPRLDVRCIYNKASSNVIKSEIASLCPPLRLRSADSHPPRLGIPLFQAEMTKILRIQDEKTTFLRWSISNETLTCQLALCQLVIVLVSLAQHVFSLLRHNHVFLCQFNRTALPDEEYSSFLAYDVIIFGEYCVDVPG